MRCLPDANASPRLLSRAVALIGLLIAAAFLTGCDRNQSGDEPQQPDRSAEQAQPSEQARSAEREEPAQRQRSLTELLEAVPEDHRASYQQELRRARELDLELPPVEEGAPEGPGDEVLEEALARFESAQMGPLGRDLMEAVRSGEEPPPQVLAIIEQHDEALVELREALRHRNFQPDVPISGSRDAGAEGPAHAAARLLAASSRLAETDECFVRSAETLRLAFAHTYGQGYMGALEQSALSQWALAAAEGCAIDASEEDATNAQRRFRQLRDARPTLAHATYFEWISQIPELGPIATGEAQDPELSQQQARQVVDYRMEHLSEVYRLTGEDHYEFQIERLSELHAPGQAEQNPVFRLDAGLFDQIKQADQALQEDLVRLVVRLGELHRD